jgi:hypothetical protein
MSNDHTQPAPDDTGASADRHPELTQGLKALYAETNSGVSENARARLDARVLELAKGHFAAAAADPAPADHPMRLHPGPVAGGDRPRRDLPIFVRYRWAISGVGLAAAISFAFVLLTQTNTPTPNQPTSPNYGRTASTATTESFEPNAGTPLPSTGATARGGDINTPPIGTGGPDVSGATLAAKAADAGQPSNPAWYDDLLRKTETARTPDIVDAHRVALLASVTLSADKAQLEQTGEDVRAALALGGSGVLTFAEVDQLASRAVSLNLGASPGAGIDCPEFWALDIPVDDDSAAAADEFVRPNVAQSRGTGS